MMARQFNKMSRNYILRCVAAEESGFLDATLAQASKPPRTLHHNA